MRCFIAVDIDPSLTGKIKSLQSQIKNLDVKLVEENNLHFTLKFLGDVHESKLKDIEAKLAEVAFSVNSFEINLRGVGVFPNEKFIRVVWAGCEDENFIDLHNSVNDALAKLFKKEKAVPHLTIARVRSAKDNAKIMDFVKRHKTAEIGAMLVGKIRLKKSTLKQSGPIYDDVAVFGLSS